VRVVFLANQRSANGLYRAVLPMTGLVQHGHDVRAVVPKAKGTFGQHLADADVLLVHRYCDTPTQRLMRYARERGIAVVWDDDDDAGSNRGTTVYRQASALTWERRRADVNRVLGLADVVTAPSAELAGRFSQRGAGSVAVIENYVPSLFLKVRPEPHDGVTIGWVAGAEHDFDAEQLSIAAVLQRVLDARSDVRVVTMGLRLPIDSDRYEHDRGVKLVEFTADRRAHGGRTSNVHMQRAVPGLVNRIAQFDIAIAPLADAPFNRARSNVKLKEYAAAGVPWLASPTGPYAGMGEAQGGRLVPDDGWYDALLRLVDKPRERRKLAKRARKWVAEQTIEQNVERWEAVLDDAVAHAGGARPALVG
jgi:glycosyltransferase involved in cell wall biosynthesis